MLKYRQWDRSLCRHHYCRDRSTYNRYKTIQESQNLIIKSSSFSLIWFFFCISSHQSYTFFPCFVFFRWYQIRTSWQHHLINVFFFCKCISYFIYKSYLFCLMLRYDMMFVYGIFPSLFTYWLSLWSLHF